MMGHHYKLPDFKWLVIKLRLPRREREDERRVLNGNFWVLRASDGGALLHAAREIVVAAIL